MITSHVFFIKLTPLRIQSQKTDDIETSSQFQHYLACKNTRGLEKHCWEKLVSSTLS